MAWPKGKKRIVTWGNKISIGKMGHFVSIETRRKIGLTSMGRPAWNKGKKMSEEFKQKISKYKIGKKLSEETKRKIGEASKRLGLKPPINYREKNWKWIEDRTKLKIYKNSEERRSPRYKDWRRRVCNRDNWKCKIANKDCKGRLEVHHILSFTKFPELKYEINNGIALCHAHHPQKRSEEVKLSPYFQNLVALSDQFGHRR